MSDQNQNNQSSSEYGKQLKGLFGLHTFKNHLERDFFANATVRETLNKENTIDLVIELDCNFGLTESLFYLNNGNWGSFYTSKSKTFKASPFQTALFNLSEENGINVDIAELSINLKDTSIIITKIYNRSVPDQLGNILCHVSENFVHFTKGLTEMPYEIFIPVFEEQEQDVIKSMVSTTKSKTDYFDFWGLYFESNIDSAIYDLKNKSIIDEGDFFLLNQ
ncbi:hypothetical protein [Croceitalea rosinachiae]|uniref:Uncharacterized protein n=1 Tax=Croceitalea rosinachiae TaxID=3075596 RepID=A0ABU3AAU4_9FLAO|nr:hypothetical protein [Croceitalea sp. F388]MDT0607301.1 hypothetical protein [Croceitalea sp. F388]